MSATIVSIAKYENALIFYCTTDIAGKFTSLAAQTDSFLNLNKNSSLREGTM